MQSNSECALDRIAINGNTGERHGHKLQSLAPRSLACDWQRIMTAMYPRAISVSFMSSTYYSSFVLVSATLEITGKSWSTLNDPKHTFPVDMGSSLDLITQKCLPKANVLRFKTRDEVFKNFVSAWAECNWPEPVNSPSRKILGLSYWP